jgi:acetyl-CoA acyltransferase
MTQLARQFAEHTDVRYGITTMCVGLGQGGTVVWENPHHPDYEGYRPAAMTIDGSAR